MYRFYKKLGQNWNIKSGKSIKSCHLVKILVRLRKKISVLQYIFYLCVMLFVGTGSSCVYPLLACKINSTWNFLALEKCDSNFTYAERNIERNDAKDKVTSKFTIHMH